ncbi:helix-turn-helix domain-containing protein [Streptomyces sp. 4N509B]|uniref:helix-turn-helix domain-containing protein n=1 Tax=Streptomyces sp. 4N509B TaxID=3457413 RepID=UPI003FD30A68
MSAPRDQRSEPDGAQRAELGAAIRRLRKDKGMTLVQLAQRADLSHPFLSQLERGLTHPSMRSLHRIALALDTTQQRLLATSVPLPADTGRGPGCPGVRVVRAGDGEAVPNGVGTARVLGTAHLRVHPVEFRGLRTAYGDYYDHPGDEFLYILKGEVEVEIVTEGGGPERHELAPGDSISYLGGTPHRWRALANGPSDDVRLLAVQPTPPGDPPCNND